MTYKQWFKKWQRQGSPRWPEFVKVMLISWTDAAYSEEETGTIDAIKCGLLVEATRDHICLAMEGFEDRESRTKITVPAGMVNTIILDGPAVKAFE